MDFVIGVGWLIFVLFLFVVLTSELIVVLIRATKGWSELEQDNYPNPRIEEAKEHFKTIRKASISGGIIILVLLGSLLFVLVKQRFF